MGELRNRLFWLAFAVLFDQQWVAAVRFYRWESVGGEARIYWLVANEKLERYYVSKIGTTGLAVYDAHPEQQRAVGWLLGDLWRVAFNPVTSLPEQIFC